MNRKRPSFRDSAWLPASCSSRRSAVAGMLPACRRFTSSHNSKTSWRPEHRGTHALRRKRTAASGLRHAGPIELRARTVSFKWQVSPLLLYSLPWHRARTEPSRKVSCQSASCRATLFGGSREKCFAFRSRSVDGTEYVPGLLSQRQKGGEGHSAALIFLLTIVAITTKTG